MNGKRRESPLPDRIPLDASPAMAPRSLVALPGAQKSSPWIPSRTSQVFKAGDELSMRGLRYLPDQT